ncbi:unnamed protein product [Aphanomyces euteiches]
MVSSSKMSVAVRLLEPEGYIVHAPPTQTITIYSTDSPGAIPRAKAYVQARLNAIVQANPWLTGRVVTDFIGTNLSLQYDPTANTLPLEESSMPKLSTAMDYQELTNLFKPLEVRQGTDLINKDEPPFRVHWITITPTRCALFMTISHGISDGYTYYRYRLYGMLSATTPIQTLDPNRFYDFEQVSNVNSAWGNDSAALMSRFPLICNILGTLLFSPKPNYALRTISKDWIAREKAKAVAHLPHVAFVSTNDVLTSWFFRECNSVVGFMTINYRGRMKGLASHLAGNYTSWLGYQPEDYASPALMRESLTSNVLRRVALATFRGFFQRTPTELGVLLLTRTMPSIEDSDGTFQPVSS